MRPFFNAANFGTAAGIGVPLDDEMDVFTAICSLGVGKLAPNQYLGTTPRQDRWCSKCPNSR
jgi:hypothetical protein